MFQETIDHRYLMLVRYWCLDIGLSVTGNISTLLIYWNVSHPFHHHRQICLKYHSTIISRWFLSKRLVLMSFITIVLYKKEWKIVGSLKNTSTNVKKKTEKSVSLCSKMWLVNEIVSKEQQILLHLTKTTNLVHVTGGSMYLNYSLAILQVVLLTGG